MIAAVVSVGTNSTRLLVAGTANGKTRRLAARSVVTRIGEGLKERGRLKEDAMQRTLDVLEGYAREARQHTNKIYAIATSAVRRADNEGDFARRVREVTGAELEIISGEEEARRSYMGAVSGAKGSPPFTVVDSGGGSTEFAHGDASREETAVSCEIGAVRLTEQFPELGGERGAVSAETLAQARICIREALMPAREMPQPKTLLFVGGTANTAIGIAMGERTDFEYAALPRDTVAALLERLRALPLDRRKTVPGMNPDRADIMPAGLLILDEAFALTGHSEATATTNDLLLGTLLRRLER